MDDLKAKYLARIEGLLVLAIKVQSTHVDELFVGGFETLNNVMYQEWLSRCKNLLLSVVNKENHFYQDFTEKTKDGAHLRCLSSGVGMLNALKEEIKLGILVKVKTLALAEVLSDFLKMAQHLLENDRKDLATFLVGIVLEDGLRKLAKENSIYMMKGSDISAVNQKLADNEIYSRLTQSQIQTWKKLCDSAAHGKVAEYDEKEVKAFLDGTRAFLVKHLS